MISFEELTHLFGEDIVAEYVDEYDRFYTLTKDFKNRYTLYKKSIYGNSYSNAAKNKKQIKEYIDINKLTRLK